MAVTPVVGFIGEYSDLKLNINKDEVDQVFTISIADLLDLSKWEHKEFGPGSSFTGAFNGGPFVVWGLTAYILDRFLKEIIRQCNVVTSVSSSA